MSRETRLLTPAQSTAAKAAAGAAAAVLAAGAWLAPGRAWPALLLGNVYFAALALGAAVFVAVQRAASAGWPALLRRVPESMTAYLPAGAVLAAAVLAAARWVYPWAADGGARALGANARWLSVPAAAVRAALCWGAWIVLTRRLAALSREQDAAVGPEPTRRAAALSAVFLVAFAATFTVFSVDAVMSLEPRWSSTIYPWFLFAGTFEAGLAATIVLVVALRRRGAFPELNEHHLHDLGKYLFAFACFWAYLWFSQYLLIWYSNIPDETTHYLLRLSRGWAPLFWGNFVVNFVLPFALLLPARRKKRERTLLLGAGVVLFGWALDLYVLIMPPVQGPRPLLGPFELAAFVLPGALFLLAFDRAFASAPSEPVRDPFLDESRRFSGV